MRPSSISQGLLEILKGGGSHTALELERSLRIRYDIYATGSSVTAKIRWLRDTKRKKIVCIRSMVKGKQTYEYRLLNGKLIVLDQ